MAIPFKKIKRQNPLDLDASPKFYIQLVTMGQTVTLDTIAYEMKEFSSLSVGDIKSVLVNFVTVMRRALYNGHSVNIEGFGVFNLSAHSDGCETAADCTVKAIRNIRVTFRAAKSIHPDPNSKVLGEVMNFVDLEKVTEEDKEKEAGKV